jgi:GDSL-like lipase/acylhydrolase family protein
MRTWTAWGHAVTVAALVLCGAAALAKPVDVCEVPGYLLFGDTALNAVNAAVTKDKTLKIVVLGGTSSTLPGPNGLKLAYPARLEATLASRLPGVKVTVAAHTKSRQSAAEMASGIAQIVDQKPNLVVWQTGTYDAVHGTDPEQFRSSVADGVDKLRKNASDVVLMNMQYSPRTESIVAVGAYADAMRWVARELDVPEFDRMEIMRHWYDSGQFDLYAATKDMKLAMSVHDCIGKALAAMIIDAARLEASDGAPQQ